MKLQYIVTPDDFIQFNLWSQSRLVTIEKNIEKVKRLSIIFSILLILYTLLIWKFQGMGTYMFCLLAVSYIYRAVTYRKSYMQGTKHNIRDMINEGKYIECFGPTLLELGQDKLYQEREGRTLICPYSKIQEVAINANCVYVMVGTATVCVVPFSAFMSEQQMLEFVRVIKQKANLT